MLSDFTWNMTGYIPKHQVNPHGDGIIPYVAERIFQLEPEPPKVGNLNEYILSALQEKNLIYFSFFLHHYEPQLNKRIKDFLGVDGGDLYDTDRFIDIKALLRTNAQKLMDRPQLYKFLIDIAESTYPPALQEGHRRGESLLERAQGRAGTEIITRNKTGCCTSQPLSLAVARQPLPRELWRRDKALRNAKASPR